jgi:hypothetical protein
MPGRRPAEEGGSDEPVAGHPDAAQRRPVRRPGRDRLGTRARLVGQRPGGLPDRVRAQAGTGGPPAAGAAGRLPRLGHRLCQQHRWRRARLQRWPPAASWSCWLARWSCWSRSSGGWSPPSRHRDRPSRRCEPGGVAVTLCAPSSRWPASPWRPGLSTPTATGSVCSSSRSRSGDRPLGHPGSPWRAGQSTATTPAPDRRRVRHPRKETLS